ncbi:hypothetical protein PAHAL_1G448300 [Panicum hallii]|uniref:Uncharacterized protein n=1 Tax=Panicum hallii TaxID=206008 RepID=A0A2T8KYE0_9POAL|nr:hypothetical protein PAHAL_1G448300 [Panicum hallii]
MLQHHVRSSVAAAHCSIMLGSGGSGPLRSPTCITVRSSNQQARQAVTGTCPEQPKAARPCCCVTGDASRVEPDKFTSHGTFRSMWRSVVYPSIHILHK